MEKQDIFRVEIDDGVARCSMNGPKMNAMGRDLIAPLMDNLNGVLKNDDVRVIVIRGEGGNFSTGADIDMMEDLDPTFLNESMRAMGEVLLELHEGPKPVITEVDGWAVGGGLGLALASDITYATERARFFASFVRFSIVPDFGTSYFLTKRVGLAIAKEIALTGRIIDAEEAFRIGLINRIVPHEEISEKVMKLAGRIAGRSPNILALTKRFLNVGHKLDLQTFLDLESHVQSMAILAPEHKKDVEDFLKSQERGSG